MSEDLRRVVAKSAVEKRKNPCNRWPPGTWQAAALYNSIPKPETRHLVIIGGDSFIKPAGELRDICQLPSSSAVVETTTCSILPLRNEKQREVHTVHIADVEWPQWYHVQQRTGGKMTCVWFRGKRSLAWLAWGPKAEEAKPDDAKADEAKADEEKTEE